MKGALLLFTEPQEVYAITAYVRSETAPGSVGTQACRQIRSVNPSGFK